MPPECRFAYDACAELLTDRQIGMGVGPIPFTAVDAYARRYGIVDLDEFDDFLTHIRIIEALYDRHRPKKS